MGVHGLWQLLQPAGRPVTLESLEGKVLAVDVSIWLHQTMKGMRDKDGNPLPNAHLQGLFSRVCKLLFYRIKPIFVFDGGVPVLKRNTLAARKDRREEAERESSEVAQKLLHNLVKSQAVKEALGVSGSPEKASSSKQPRVPGVRRGRNQKDVDIFQLTPLPDSEQISLVQEAEEWERDFEQQEAWIKEGLAALSDTNPDADEFKSLPAEIQHEILRELKERKKYHTLSHLTKMPEDSEDFSSYQLKRLMKQCRLTTRMEEVRREMTNQTAMDATDALKVQVDGNKFEGDEVEARRIVSEDASHYVLIKGISSVSQIEQAGRYDLERKVKVEDSDDDDEYGKPRLQGSDISKQSSPEKKSSAGKAPVKILSTDESDSDVEMVMAGRTRGKRKKRISRGTRASVKDGDLARKKVKADVPVARKTAGAANQRITTAAVSSCSSEDEGFIEVTVDTNAPLEEDDLFPASIFEQPANIDVNLGEQEALMKSIADTVNTNTSGKKDSDAHLGSKTKISRINEGGIYEVRNRRETNYEDKKEKTQQTAGDGVEDLRNHAEVMTDKQKDVINDVQSQTPDRGNMRLELSTVSKEEAAAAKRKSVLGDILGQLQAKKKKLNEELGMSPDNTTSTSETNGSIPNLRSEGPSSSLNGDERKNKEGGKFNTDEFMEEGSFHSSEHSANRDRCGERERVQNFNGTVRSNNLVKPDGGGDELCAHTLSSSDSDEDLKLAKELSLKQITTHPTKSDENVESDEDLKLAIKLSLQANQNGSKFTAQADQVEVERPNFQKVLSSSSSSSSNDERNDDFEDVEDNHADEQDNTLRLEAVDRSGNVDTEKVAAQFLHSNRTQPEDFEAHEEVEETEGETTHFPPPPVFSEETLQDFRAELDSERTALINQQGRNNRMATTVTEQINLDAQDLLRLFGVPFIVSPLEAEAQCAFLEAAGLTEGTITDDSDFWLFGGQRLYKNFFNQNKHVELYTMSNIQNHFSLSRDQLINIALLCGSDYTEGIQGVGPVRALEIMAEFPGQGLDGLRKFRHWWDQAKKKPGMAPGNKIRSRLKALTLIPGFPSVAVVDAYMNPTVDDSLENFSWSGPDLDLLREFSKAKFGWNKEKSDQSLEPMYKAWSRTQSQGRIQSYFGPDAFVQTSQLKSERLRKALEQVKKQGSDHQTSATDQVICGDDDVYDATATQRKKAKTAKKAKARQKSGSVDKNDEEKAELDQGGLKGNAEKKGTKAGVRKGKKQADGKRVRFSEDSVCVDNVGNTAANSGMNDEGRLARDHQEVEEEDDDFMTRMSEKVKQAKDKLEKMEEARKFACKVDAKTIVKEEEDEEEEERNEKSKKTLPSKGRGSARGRGVRSKARGRGGSIPISLDILPKSRMSRGRGRSASGSSRAAGATNLSESSSSDQSEDESGDESVVNRSKQSKISKPVKVSKNSGAVGVSQGKNNKSKLTMKDKIGEGKSGGEMWQEGLEVGSKELTSKIGVKQPEAPKLSLPLAEELSNSKKSKSNIAVSLGDLGTKQTIKKGYHGNMDPALKQAEKTLVRGGRQGEKLEEGKGDDEKPYENRLDKEVKATARNLRKEECARQEADNAVGSNSLEKIVEKTLASKTLTAQHADDTGNAKNSGEVVDSKSGMEEEEVVDITKADVSVINRQNLPATLAYLNQRSRHDKALLAQIAGRRPRNAVEQRLEEEERRGEMVQPVPKKDRRGDGDNNENNRGVGMASGLSFGDVLGGCDDVRAVNKTKKKKAPTQCDMSPSKKAKSDTVKERVSKDDLNADVSRQSSKSSDESKLYKFKKMDFVDDELCHHSTKNSFQSYDKPKKTQTTKQVADRIDSELGNLRKTCEEKITSVPFTSDGKNKKDLTLKIPQERGLNTKERQSDVDIDWDIYYSDIIASELRGGESQRAMGSARRLPKVKSRRSHAFDRPIGKESSESEDEQLSPRVGFQNQLKHLHEPRSVKGHGPVYSSNQMTFVEKGRAFAGKGKGRGKNRSVSAGAVGGFLSKQEKEEADGLTLEDLGSDFSDDCF